jgi:hypothetical protein
MCLRYVDHCSYQAVPGFDIIRNEMSSSTNLEWSKRRGFARLEMKICLGGGQCIGAWGLFSFILRRRRYSPVATTT